MSKSPHEKKIESIYVRQLRAEAKKHKKAGYEKTHCQILEEIAIREGYKTWKGLTTKNNQG